MPGEKYHHSYQQLDDDDYYDDENNTRDLYEELEPTEPNDNITKVDDVRGSPLPMKFSKSCLKNVFTVLLIFIYLLLTAVAAFLAYQTISDFLNKLNQPVMSVSYKEVDFFSPPGIALYPGNAEMLSCRHHYHNYIPPLVDPGKPQKGDCEMINLTYYGHYANVSEKRVVVVRGPSDVKNKELVFLQFSQNETQEDFSGITYMLFAKFSDLVDSENKSDFMRACEKNYSTWTFSGGFRTWVKMSLVKTSGTKNEGMEFRQESSVVQFNDKRPEQEQTNLFFVVFEWRDPYMQEIQLIVTANPWSSIAILCGVFMALFKAANFAKLTITWIIKMRKRHLKNKAKELAPIN